MNEFVSEQEGAACIPLLIITRQEDPFSSQEENKAPTMTLQFSKQSLVLKYEKRRKRTRPSPEEEGSMEQDKKCEVYQANEGIPQEIKKERKAVSTYQVQEETLEPSPQEVPRKRKRLLQLMQVAKKTRASAIRSILRENITSEDPYGSSNMLTVFC